MCICSVIYDAIYNVICNVIYDVISNVIFNVSCNFIFDVICNVIYDVIWLLMYWVVLYSYGSLSHCTASVVQLTSEAALTVILSVVWISLPVLSVQVSGVCAVVCGGKCRLCFHGVTHISLLICDFLSEFILQHMYDITGKHVICCDVMLE